MKENDLAAFRGLSFIESRIPALDALATFVPKGEEDDPVLKQAMARTGCSRWYPVEGGHRVLILQERGKYDAERFKLEKGVWDHEHCKICNDRIDSMTLCWVTESGPYVIICDACHEKLEESSA